MMRPKRRREDTNMAHQAWWLGEDSRMIFTEQTIQRSGWAESSNIVECNSCRTDYQRCGWAEVMLCQLLLTLNDILAEPTIVP